MLQQSSRAIAHMILLLIVSSSGLAQKRFTNVTDSAGINHQFVVFEGMFGGGAVVLDVNNDGWEDVYLTGGVADDALYLNNKNGTFKNIFQTSGLTDTRNYVTQGAATADVNKDGWLDLFVTTITFRDTVKRIPRAENLLFLNNGNSTFRNVTQEFGLKDLESFSTGVSFGDFDLDGFTDAYVGNYFFGYEGKLTYINDSDIVQSSQTAAPYLLKNVNGRKFIDVTKAYGLNYKGFGFGGAFTDYDRDNDLDIFVNHDFGYKATPNVFLENEFPDASFIERSKNLHLDLKINAMGTAIGDYDNNGLMDYYVTNIRFNRFMVNHGKNEPFTEEAKSSGMDFVSISWGANFADFDHDRDVDLFVANGDLNPNDVPLADYYFENTNGTFREKAAFVGVNDYGIGRGSVVFDMDNDGDLDLLVVNQKAVLDYPVRTFTTLFRNDSTHGNWLKVKLVGQQSDKNGIGALIEVSAEGVKMIREVDGGSSHLSQNSLITHFGLGSALKVDYVKVTWPGGKTQTLHDQLANQLLVIEEKPGEEKNNFALAIAVGILLVVLMILLMVRKGKKHKSSVSKNTVLK
ncbi:MAG TPA: CRTAC1 family protein [Chryseosolibacter sp.]